MVDFSNCINILINLQPFEAFPACCTLVNTGVWASIVPVAGLGSAHLGERARAHFTSPFSGKYCGIDLGLHHHNLVNVLTLYTPVCATVSFKCMMHELSFADQASSKMHE